MEHGADNGPELRESVNDQNNGERYTEVDNDVLFNPIEGYDANAEGEKEVKPEENPENPNTSKVEIKSKNKINNNKRTMKKLKIILLGEIGVGKSSLINRYVNNKFSNFSELSLDSDVKIKKVEVEQTITAELLINDPTNEEKMGKFPKNYYLDAHGALIVFDLCNEQSFQKVKYWMEELNSNGPRDVIICILGNKADLTADRCVKLEEAKDLANDNLYYEVSAKTGNNVSLAFEQLTYGIIEKQKEEQNNPDKVLRGKEGRKTADLNDIKRDEKKLNKRCC
jgi:small GTP-binding protein